MPTFNEVSALSRASNVFIELAGMRRSLASLFIPPTVGLIGLYDAAKTSVVPYVGIKVSSKERVGELFGYGSHIHRQALAMPDEVFENGGGVYAFPVPNPTAGTPTNASQTVTFTGPATSAGTLYFSIGGDLVEVVVANGDTAAAVSDALNDAVDALRDIAVTAAVGGTGSEHICTLTAKFDGVPGNEIRIVQNPSGDAQEAAAPAGITVTIGGTGGYLASGAGTIAIESIFTSSSEDILGDRWYTIFTCPFVDATNIASMKAAAIDRAGADIHRMFGAYAGYVSQTYDQAAAIPATINSKHIGAVYDARCYAPAFELGAALVGRIAYEQNLAPNRPYKNTAVGLACDGETGDRNWGKNDALFRAGIGYCKVGADGDMYFGDIPLTYRTTATGAASEEWFDAVSLHLRQAKAYSIEQLFNSEPYTRGVVVDNDAVTPYEWAISPKDVIADLIKLVDELWAPYGWTKNKDDVIADLTAEINATYGGRIDAQITDDEARALRIIAIKYAFLY